MSVSVSRPDVACLNGEWRLPHNDLQHQSVGGGHKAIHDDATGKLSSLKTPTILHGPLADVFA
jgi:hypothetical protein